MSNQLVEDVYETCKNNGVELSKTNVKMIVDNVFYSLMNALKTEGEVKFPMNFGKLRIKKMSARVMKIFGEQKKVPARTKISFRPGKPLKDFLK